MNTPYLAHIAEDGRQQTVLEHLRGTAALAEAFAADFGAAEQGRLAGLAHDIGKNSDAFQRRLHGDPAHVDHSTAGAFACWQRRQAYAAFAVAGHHGGLLDFGSRTAPDGTFQGRMQKAQGGGLPSFDGWESELTLPDTAPPDISNELDAVFFARMLYSCLVDADFLDTETFMDGAPRESMSADMDKLYQRLKKYIAPWFPPKGELNAQRCAILERCLSEGQASRPGLFTLTVPTGGGKTVSSLAFALAHAREHGLKRIIYVIPYTSIIEQTADTFRKILGEENVLEHHSAVVFDIDGEASPEKIRQAKATENWDAPVIVTTAVQFFESLFSNRASKCRKLHNLARSVIIFDEAQMMPISCIQPCVYVIAELVKNYGSSAVLCTATQPALGPIFKKYLPGISPKELCPEESFRCEDFSRVYFRKEGRLNWDELAGRINALPQALCIVNSRKSAQTLYSLLSGDGCFHLSTLMCPAHRKQQLDEIRSRLKKNLPCRVVSTSLIEAGVDVDFPAVFREENGLDSILQAAGRCNREGARPREQSIVTIFQSEASVPPLFRTCTDVGRQILKHCDDPSAPEAIHDYFQSLLYLKGDDAQDIYKIIPLIKSEPFPYKKIAERFQMIDSATKTVFIPMDGTARELLERYNNGERSRALMQKLGQYSVGIYAAHYAELEKIGVLSVLGDDMAVLEDMELYGEQTGLSLEADSGKALFI